MVGGDSQHYFVTPDGKRRFVDQFDASAVAHESKAGYTTLTHRIQDKISKDVKLREAGNVNGIHCPIRQTEGDKDDV